MKKKTRQNSAVSVKQYEYARRSDPICLWHSFVPKVDIFTFYVIIIAKKSKINFNHGGKRMENLVEFLKNSITDQMSLDDIISAFERMCSIPIENDMILFETGTFSFTGIPLFYFSLVRQFPNEDEEFYQVHVDVLYEPTSQNKAFNETTWNEDLHENIFEYIRKSQAFAYARNEKYLNVTILMDET